MLAIEAGALAMELLDRRLLLVLQSVSAEELGELLDEAAPRVMPDPRRRNHVSDELTEQQKAAFAASVAPLEGEGGVVDDDADADPDESELEAGEDPG
jgi:hypothetical protein